MVSSKCCGSHIGFHRMPQINSVRGLSGIKAILNYEVNLTRGCQDIVFTSNCERTDGRTAQRTGPFHIGNTVHKMN